MGDSQDGKGERHIPLNRFRLKRRRPNRDRRRVLNFETAHKLRGHCRCWGRGQFADQPATSQRNFDETGELIPHSAVGRKARTGSPLSIARAAQLS